MVCLPAFSEDGCVTHWTHHQNNITCSCNHLTYFGILIVRLGSFKEAIVCPLFFTSINKHLSELPQTLQLHKDMPDHYSLYLNSAFKQAFQVVLGKRPQAKNKLQSLVIPMGLKVTQLLRKITFYNILFRSSVSFNLSSPFRNGDERLRPQTTKLHSCIW